MDDLSNPTHAIDSVLADESISALRRCIMTLEEENLQLINRMARSPYVDCLHLPSFIAHLINIANSIHSWTQDGHAICCLVSLIDPVTDLIVEYDWCLMAAGGDKGLDLIESTAE